jgi:hypothetical protein
MDKYDSPDTTSRAAINGAVETYQAAQRSTLLGNLQFIGHAASSQAAQNKPTPGARE